MHNMNMIYSEKDITTSVLEHVRFRSVLLVQTLAASEGPVAQKSRCLSSQQVHLAVLVGAHELSQRSWGAETLQSGC